MGSFLVLLRLPIVDIFCRVMVEQRKDVKKYTIMCQAYKDPRVGVEELEQLYTFLRNFGVNISRCGVARDLIKWPGTCRYRSQNFIRSRVMLCKSRTSAWRLVVWVKLNRWQMRRERHVARGSECARKVAAVPSEKHKTVGRSPSQPANVSDRMLYFLKKIKKISGDLCEYGCVMCR